MGWLERISTKKSVKVELHLDTYQHFEDFVAFIRVYEGTPEVQPSDVLEQILVNFLGGQSAIVKTFKDSHKGAEPDRSTPFPPTTPAAATPIKLKPGALDATLEGGAE